LTQIQSALATFGINLIELPGRAGLDKVLAIAGSVSSAADLLQSASHAATLNHALQEQRN
jgi:hypothetical protein